MYFYDNGVPIASLSLVAREDKIAQKSDVFKRFIEATAEGWKMAMADPDKAIEDLQKVFPETENSAASLKQAAAFSFASVCPGGTGDVIGVTAPETWEKMFSVMTTAMSMSNDKPVTTYYTNELAPATPVTCP
jgi:NitT/TauT family transport system substrate-binding protein